MTASFEYLQVKKKKKYKEVKDEDLVKEAQMDMDNYRSRCEWSCPSCGKKDSYTNSILKTGELYVHEIRSYNLGIKCDSSSSCKKKMDLVSNNSEEFHSDAFDELFARYQGWIIYESEKARGIDSPEEIYCELCGSFSKIVGMFARGDNFSKVSEKWFSSFFYKSMKNKISDIQKTKNYQKRSPMVKCEICGEYVGKITAKHLLSPGHEEFVQKIYASIGRQILEDSGEINYYESEKEIERRSLILGAINLSRKEKSKANEILKRKALLMYFTLYPHAKTKNNLLSTNMPIDEEENSTIEDTKCESVTSCGTQNAVEDIYVQETVDILVNVFYENNKKNSKIVDRMFRDDLNHSRKTTIIKEIIYDKMSYNSVKNSDLDRSYSEYVKNGFTSKILRMIKGDKVCRMELLSAMREK